MIVIFVDDEITWEVRSPRKGSDDSWVAVCSQLGLSVESKDRDELLRLASQALDSLTDDLRENNDALKFLVEHGIRFHVQPVKDTGTGFTVPVPTIAAKDTEGALPA